MLTNEISGAIVDSAMHVHSEFDPGLLESTYEACLLYELKSRDLFVQNQLTLPVTYKNERIDTGYRIDLLVEKAIIVELKAVDKLLPIHETQRLTYLKLSHKKVGLLINFNTPRLKYGIKRLVN
ncbi:MAG: GxxExxY protein [Gammaproteobacteria bacterium]|nr:MAG: GxxExxY protein [Gammaproteobacteria bacterium]